MRGGPGRGFNAALTAKFILEQEINALKNAILEAQRERDEARDKLRQYELVMTQEDEQIVRDVQRLEAERDRLARLCEDVDDALNDTCNDQAERLAQRVMEMHEERDRLRALLREVEWIRVLDTAGDWYWTCPACLVDRDVRGGHVVGCRLLAALETIASALGERNDPR